MSDKDLHNDELNKGEENFSLPENYFDSFSERLFKKINSENELKDYQVLSSLQKENSFAVPADYFESKEELLPYPILAKNRQNKFSVPANYFESISSNVANKISVEEEKEQFVQLYSLKDNTAFHIPSNYFENFVVNRPAKVISLFSRVSISYRVAAALALFVGLAFFFYKYQSKAVVANDCHTFACLSKQDILNSSYVMHVSDDNIIDLIDEKSLNDTLLLKENGKTQKITVDDISDNVDINTLTDNL